MSILDTIVVKFGEGVDSSNANISILLDVVLNGVIDGVEKTSFHPGEICYLLAHIPTPYKLDRITYTSGDVSVLGVVERSVKERIFFSDADTEVQLSFLPSSGIAINWFGRSATITKKGSDLSATEETVPAIGDATYKYKAYSLRVAPPSISLGEDEDWPLGIVIWVTE